MDPVGHAAPIQGCLALEVALPRKRTVPERLSEALHGGMSEGEHVPLPVSCQTRYRPLPWDVAGIDGAGSRSPGSGCAWLEPTQIDDGCTPQVFWGRDVCRPPGVVVFSGQHERYALP